MESEAAAAAFLGQRHSQAERVGELALQRQRVLVLCRRPPAASAPPLADEALDAAHAQPVRHDPARQCDRVGVGEQGAGMAGGKRAVIDKAAHRLRQGEQSQHVGDMRPAAAHHGREPFLRAAEFLQEPLVALGFLDRRKGVALDVLGERRFHRAPVVERAHGDRDFRQPGAVGGMPAPFAGDDLVMARLPRQGPRQDRLQDAVLADGLRKRIERRFAELPPGLEPAGREPANRNRAGAGWRGPVRGRHVRDQRREAAAEAGRSVAAHGAPSSRRRNSPAKRI